RRRVRRGDGADGDDAARRHHRRRTRADAGRARGDRRGARRVRGLLPELEGLRARLRVPGSALGVVLPRWLVPLPARRGQRRAALDRAGRERRRGLLRSRWGVRLRLRGGTVVEPPDLTSERADRSRRRTMTAVAGWASNGGGGPW